MRRVIPLVLLSLLFACGGKPNKRPSHSGGNGEAVPGEDGAGGGSDSGKGMGEDGKGGGTAPGGGDSDKVPGGYTPSPGSAMRLLDGAALSIVYKRVFPLRSYGFEICRRDEIKKYRGITDCSESIFEMDERAFVGTKGLNTPDLNRGFQNLRLPEDLTLNYMRTLRAGLSRECEARMILEWDQLSQGKEAQNFLIKGEKPSKAAIEEFLRRILGIEGTNLPVEIDADAYLLAFAAVTGGKTDPTTLKHAYFGLCISIAMDPQIFIY